MLFLEGPNLQSRKIKDLQFVSSVKFGISLAIALIMTPIILVLMLVFIPTWWIAVLAFFSLPLAGLFAWNFYLLALRVIGGLRIIKYIRTKNNGYLQLKKNYDELVSLVASL
jgi:hypothetical protein